MAVSNYVSWNFRRHVALFLLFIVFVEGAQDLYSNSFISPNSAKDDIIDLMEIESGYKTLAPNEIRDTNKKPVHSKVIRTAQFREDGSIYTHSIDGSRNREKRSANPDPILSRTSDVDNLLTYKNVEDSLDSNDVELSARTRSFIQPSKTEKELESKWTKPTVDTSSGEARGAPQARSLPLQEPQEIKPTATIAGLNIATLSHQQGKGRQANPDIQDIITGIVKLLNGNVNVQANTAPAMGRPLRPLSTRINNRGPPRITDLPALPPDFDVPAPPLPPPPLGQMPPPVTSSRFPTPYPFDLPPHNSSPKRPYPTNEGPGKRPGFYRPVTIPPWDMKPPRRPPNTRRPIPPYKPLPPLHSTEDISLTSERPIEDILTLDLGSQLQPTSEEIKPNDTSDERDKTSILQLNTQAQNASSPTVDKEILEFEKKKEKSSSKMDKHTKTTMAKLNSTSSIHSTNLEQTSSSEIESSTTETKVISGSEISSSEATTEIEPSHITTEIMSTPMLNSTIVNIININESNPVDNIEESTPTLESSIQDVSQTLREDNSANTTASPTPTEALPPTSVNNVVSTTTETSSSLKLKTVQDTATTITSTTSAELNQSQSSQQGFPYFPYRPRPGIVLDDTEYKPGGINRQPIITRPPIGQIGDIFDITVSAIQGPGGSGSSSAQGKPYVIPVDIENVHVGQNVDVITSPVGDEGFVSIDGKRTYLNLFGENAVPSTTSASVIKPSTSVHNQVTGTGYAVVETEKTKPNVGSVKPTQRRPLYGRPRPSHPPVRIDTCIVGDDSTCDVSQHEICKTEAGVSACHCRPGHARRKHREPCRKIVSVLISLRVDRLYERRVVWASELSDKSSDSYQQLSYEAERALESAMSMTPFSDEFLGAKVNTIYKGERAAGQAGVFVNLTLQLDENPNTVRPSVRGDIQKHLLGVIQRRSNNVGNSALWVDSPPGSVSNLQDLDECSSPEFHDCHVLAKCTNTFGGFKCECDEGYRDPWADNKHRAGRHCEQCSSQHCNNRGECRYQNGQEVCVCSGNYYGNQCELDGEVLGVAIGASVAAVIIIGLTLVCLVMWSRRWSREQKSVVGSPVFGYMATASNTVKTPVVGAPPYQLTLEDRLRWAQIADVMAQANHYAPEPVTGPTRPSSAMFGYPNMSLGGTMQHGSMHGTLPPIPLPRLNLQTQMASRAASLHGMRPLDNSSSSEEEDKADLLGRNFHVPRPKSRSNASIANQSGIYYDVDYDQNEIYKQSGGIPLSTYSMGRPPYYRH